MVKLYGIPNCNTVKKARAWLDEQGIAYEFHDFKKQGVSPELIRGWLALAVLAWIALSLGIQAAVSKWSDKD